MEPVLGLAACLAAWSAIPADKPEFPQLARDGEAAVAERDGAINFFDARGRECALTPADKFTQPALSRDGRTVAFIREDVAGDPGTETARTSLWIVNVATGKRRKVLASTPAQGLTENLSAMWNPEFSLNGGFVYVMAEAWATSHAIHQVNLATGGHRYVTDGELIEIIPGGKYAGYLLVSKHRYRNGRDGAEAYDQNFIVRPDGKWSIPARPKQH